MAGTSYFQAASSALYYAKNRTPLGAMNRPFDNVRQEGLILKQFAGLYLRVGTFSAMPNSIEGIRSFANASEYWGVGNCAEQAALAFIYCYDQSIGPVSYVTIPWSMVDEHAFVVIGLSFSCRGPVAAWPASAYVCDPWNSLVYPANEVAQRLPTSTQRTTLWHTYDPGEK